MLTLPFRILGTIALALFCSSRLVRWAVSGIAVSTLIVVSQHEDVFASAGLGAGELATLSATLKALIGLLPG